MNNENETIDFRIGMTGYTWNKVVSLLKTLNNEVKFKCEPEGIRVITIDPAHVSILNILILRDSLIERDITDNTVFLLDLKELPKIADNSYISLYRENGKLTIRYNNSTEMQIKELGYYDVYTPKKPALDCENEFMISAKTLRDFVVDAHKISDTIKIELTTSDKLILLSENENKNIRSEFDNKYGYNIIKQVTNNSISYYPLDYLYKLMKNTKSVNDLYISFKTEYPIKITFKIPVTKDKKAYYPEDMIEVEYYLAIRTH